MIYCQEITAINIFKEVYVNWVYKDSVIHVSKINMPKADDNAYKVVEDLMAINKIDKPENYERYVLTAHELSEQEKLVAR